MTIPLLRSHRSCRFVIGHQDVKVNSRVELGVFGPRRVTGDAGADAHHVHIQARDVPGLCDGGLARGESAVKWVWEGR